MSSPFVAEIRIFGCNFAPTGWAFCDGQLLTISQNTALFSLLGTFYGGDGKSTFALPNLEGCAPIHAGSGAGIGVSQYFIGQIGGTETVTLLLSELPAHPHTMQASGDPADNNAPNGALAAPPLGRGNSLYIAPATQVSMNPSALTPAGGGLPHNNMMPYLTLNFCIALQGVFPPRT
jgi:microcystin-dependent protein